MLIPLPYKVENFEKFYRQFGADPKSAFGAISLIVVKRFFDQVGQRAPSDPFLQQLLMLVWESVHEEGLPQAITGKDNPEPVDLDYSYFNVLVDNVLSQLPQHRSEDDLRVLLAQIFATTLAREFRKCRRSYDSKDSQGSCIRQSLDHCKDRISGSHCEDCPYFTALSSEQHHKFLRKSWISDDPFEASTHRTFLPEDFRALRVFWHLYIRS